MNVSTYAGGYTKKFAEAIVKGLTNHFWAVPARARCRCSDATVARMYRGQAAKSTAAANATATP